MSATDTTVVFTLQEADEIAAMRETLDAVRERLSRSTFGSDFSSMTGRRLFNIGMTCEALSRAEAALFRALNVAQAYLDDDAARQAIDKSLGKDTA